MLLGLLILQIESMCRAYCPNMTDVLLSEVLVRGGRRGQDRSDLSDWLMGRIDSEVAITIVPSTLTSWDYSPRMTT